MIDALVEYLDAHNYPKRVALSEDGTTIVPNLDFDKRTGAVRGLVAPLDSDGMPRKDLFIATSLNKMISDIDNYPTGDYLYVILATPMVKGAAPFCIFYMCTDNKFDHVSVLRRWHYIVSELRKVGIEVIGVSSDGDPRLLAAMKIKTMLIRENLFLHLHLPLCIQDIIHLINKMRHSLLDLKKSMMIGKK